MMMIMASEPSIKKGRGVSRLHGLKIKKPWAASLDLPMAQAFYDSDLTSKPSSPMGRPVRRNNKSRTASRNFLISVCPSSISSPTVLAHHTFFFLFVKQAIHAL
jgi:hypothetical protein